MSNLGNVAVTAPYVHDGGAATLEEELLVALGHERHGCRATTAALAAPHPIASTPPCYRKAAWSHQGDPLRGTRLADHPRMRGNHGRLRPHRLAAPRGGAGRGIASPPAATPAWPSWQPRPTGLSSPVAGAAFLPPWSRCASSVRARTARASSPPFPAAPAHMSSPLSQASLPASLPDRCLARLGLLYERDPLERHDDAGHVERGAMARRRQGSPASHLIDPRPGPGRRGGDPRACRLVFHDDRVAHLGQAAERFLKQGGAHQPAAVAVPVDLNGAPQDVEAMVGADAAEIAAAVPAVPDRRSLQVGAVAVAKGPWPGSAPRCLRAAVRPGSWRCQCHPSTAALSIHAPHGTALSRSPRGLDQIVGRAGRDAMDVGFPAMASWPSFLREWIERCCARWITAVRAFSAVRRGSRKAGTRAAERIKGTLAQLGDGQLDPADAGLPSRAPLSAVRGSRCGG